MIISYVDYTDLYYSQIAHQPVPAVVRGKFVQIRKEDALYLVFSPRDFTKYHANIVERFCMDKGIEGNYDREGAKFIVADRAWQVIGGGTFERDGARKVLRLSDNSLAYGKFRKEGLRESVGALTELAGFELQIM